MPLQTLEALPPGLLVLLTGLLSLMVGSFLNVVIYRLPLILEREWFAELEQPWTSPAPHGPALNIMRPASHCPMCGQPIPPYRNIPLISFLLQGGYSHCCAERIPWRYPLIELLAAVTGSVLALKFGASMTLLWALSACWLLIALSAIDSQHLILPDILVYPLLWLGLLINIDATFVTLEHAVLGAVFGYSTLWGCYWLFKLATGKEGMGHGDFKLLAALGAWFGWQALPAIILIACCAGIVFGLGGMLVKALQRDTPIPFGPFLAVGGLAVLLGGTETIRLFLYL